MRSKPPPPPEPRRSHRFLGGILIASLAVAAVGLPLWLLHLPGATPLPITLNGKKEFPPSSSEFLLAAGEPAAEKTRAGGAPQGATVPETASSASRESTESAAPKTDSPPVVEHRRVGHGDGLAVLPPDGSRPASRPHGLDRSSAARQQRVQQFGGTVNTEDAVEAGLAWLAAHQSPEGWWDRVQFQRQCPQDETCPGPALERTEYSLRAGLTGLVLLAFLGAGYTDRQGPYPTTVARAVNALVRFQQPDGGFSQDGMAGYDNALATFALAEYYALTRDERVREPLQRAAQNLARGQQELGGWDYWPGGKSGRNDTSITAWAVQALQACAVAGLDVPGEVFVKALLHFSRAAEPNGQVWYADTGIGTDPGARGETLYRYGPAMVAAGMAGEQLLGWRLDSARFQKQKTLLFSQFPSASLARGGDKTLLHNEYYWYYGTVAMFQAGGDSWERWNGHLRDAVLTVQNRDKTKKGDKKHIFGSWQPFGSNWGKWGRMGGRVYSTAICVLTLEIYYRHTPAYLEEQLIVTADDWRAYLQTAGALERRRAVECLRECRLELCEPVLAELLRDEDAAVAFAAAKALTALDSPRGRPVLEQALSMLPPFERSAAEKLVQRAADLEALPPVEGRLRLFDAAHGLATLDLPRAYVGMTVFVRRAEGEIAQLRVIQRFTGRTVVLAELTDGPHGAPPETGDAVMAR